LKPPGIFDLAEINPQEFVALYRAVQVPLLHHNNKNCSADQVEKVLVKIPPCLIEQPDIFDPRAKNIILSVLLFFLQQEGLLQTLVGEYS
jgi:hypothetical protein